MVSLSTFDGYATCQGWINATPDLYDTITIATNTTLTPYHEGRLLYCTAEVTLTVDGSTEWLPHAYSRIQAAGGAVTIAESSSTVNSIDDMLTITQHGFGTLKRDAGADTYTLAGNLE
jgi:hypothetical protein